MTELYRLIGRDVSASPSPAMMSAAFRELGIDARYEAHSVQGSLDEAFDSIRRDGVRGVNVTAPYKCEVLRFLAHPDPTVARIGAANTLLRGGDGGYWGYNTDVEGIVEALRRHSVTGLRRALLLGAGGAARAFCEAAHRLGCGEVTVMVRSPASGEAFHRAMAAAFPEVSFEVVGLEGHPRGRFDLLFNATPAGFEGGLPDGLRRAIGRCGVVFDAVYRPMETGLIRYARGRGCEVVYGYEMLLLQGARAFELWTGRRAPEDAMRRALLGALGGGGL